MVALLSIHWLRSVIVLLFADMVAWLGLLVPIAYLTVLIGSLATFSSLYRARKAGWSLDFHSLSMCTQC